MHHRRAYRRAVAPERRGVRDVVSVRVDLWCHHHLVASERREAGLNGATERLHRLVCTPLIALGQRCRTAVKACRLTELQDGRSIQTWLFTEGKKTPHWRINV